MHTIYWDIASASSCICCTVINTDSSDRAFQDLSGFRFCLNPRTNISDRNVKFGGLGLVCILVVPWNVQRSLWTCAAQLSFPWATHWVSYDAPNSCSNKDRADSPESTNHLLALWGHHCLHWSSSQQLISSPHAFFMDVHPKSEREINSQSLEEIIRGLWMLVMLTLWSLIWGRRKLKRCAGTLKLCGWRNQVGQAFVLSVWKKQFEKIQSPHHSGQMSERSQVSRIAPQRCSQKR